MSARSVLLVSLLLTASVGAASAATLPAGFAETSIGGLSNPTAMAIAPDGRIFVCEQGGALRVIKNGVLLTTPFATLSVDSNGERGLLGAAFDPAFETNHYIYVYYTATTPLVHNRVSRLTANGDVAVAGSELSILDLENLSGATNHNGGAIHFGPDGKLYVAVGENANGSNSQTLSNRLGKMLRINADGSIPLDNPFVGTQGARPEIWALGLRNPFTFAFNPAGPEMFINDVGQSSWEEINDGVAGANYGWPETEGSTGDPEFTSPRYAYPNDSATCAIAGGAFYSPASFQFPSDYASDYFFADVCAGWIKRLDLNTKAVTTFATGIAGPVDVQVHADGSLYYIARESGTLTRVQYTLGPPPPPTPALTAFTNGLTLSLSWTFPGATSYILEGGTSSGAADLLNLNVGTITTVEAVVPAGTYFLRVKALTASGPSPASNEVRVVLSGSAACATPPPTPTGYTAQTSGLSVTLSWNRMPSATSYVLEAGTGPGAIDLLQADIGVVTSLAATATPATYFTRLRSRNACGASAPSSELPLVLSCQTTPPSTLTATRAGSIVTFSWTASPGATGYRMQIGSAPGLNNLANVDVGTSTMLAVSTAGAPAGVYYIRILANTSCGLTGPSNEVTVTVP